MATKHCLIALGIVILLVAAGLWLLPAWQDYCKTRQSVVNIERQLLHHQAENEELRTEIHELKTDPRAIERVARDKFGYCRPREKVYDFRQENRAPQP